MKHPRGDMLGVAGTGLEIDPSSKLSDAALGSSLVRDLWGVFCRLCVHRVCVAGKATT
jgi:hypothetical protein